MITNDVKKHIYYLCKNSMSMSPTSMIMKHDTNKIVLINDW